jgi:hypothetical protein
MYLFKIKVSLTLKKFRKEKLCLAKELHVIPVIGYDNHTDFRNGMVQDDARIFRVFCKLFI